MRQWIDLGALFTYSPGYDHNQGYKYWPYPFKSDQQQLAEAQGQAQEGSGQWSQSSGQWSEDNRWSQPEDKDQEGWKDTAAATQDQEGMRAPATNEHGSWVDHNANIGKGVPLRRSDTWNPQQAAAMLLGATSS